MRNTLGNKHATYSHSSDSRLPKYVNGNHVKIQDDTFKCLHKCSKLDSFQQTTSAQTSAYKGNNC